MKHTTNKIKKMYSTYTARYYDMHISHLFNRYKKSVFSYSSLEKGDNVLVFCCGTGLDFPYILNKIGSAGSITGVDFSPAMLECAKKKLNRYKWDNVTLINVDVTEFKSDNTYDAGVCTLGISIIPEYQKAYGNMISSVKQGGEIIIGDLQLATGFYSVFNFITLHMAKNYGGTIKGHRNSRDLQSVLETDLNNMIKKEFLFKQYYYCIGKKK